MWLIAEYEAVTLFSLKMSSATASGGKTLLAPTPFALKMALLGAACHTVGIGEAENLWPFIRELQVTLRPASQAVVTNLFQKVLKPRRKAADPEDPDAGPFGKTIGYREYVQLVGPMNIGLGWERQAEQSWLVDLLLHVNYLGKRGGFMQLTNLPEFVEIAPSDFIPLTSPQSDFTIAGTLQLMDDCTSALTFAKANVYSEEKIRLGKERIFHNVVLPYRLVKSSRSYSLYEQVE